MKVKRSSNGAALLVQLGDLFLINTYLPSGLDWASLGSRAATQARQTYEWIVDNIPLGQGGSPVQWILAGDFNETANPLHRTSGSAVPSNPLLATSTRRGVFLRDFISKTDGVDLNNGVHTFYTNGGASSSLLDRFVASRLLATRVSNYQVRPRDRRLSDHAAVQMIITVCINLPPRPHKWQWTQSKFIIPADILGRQRAFESVNISFAKLDAESNITWALRSCATSDQLEEASLSFVSALTAASRQAFRRTQGDRNRRPFRSRRNVLLNALKMNLVRLIELSQAPDLARMPYLLRAVTKAASLLLSHFSLPPAVGGVALTNWARFLLRLTRKQIKASYSEHRKLNWDSFVRAPRVSEFARKIVKKSRPHPVTTVKDPVTGQLTSDPEIVKQQLLLRVTEPMRRPNGGPTHLPADPAPGDAPVPGFPDWYHDVYDPIDCGNVWEGLCRPPTWSELRKVVGRANKHTSPGEGALGIDLIQCCLDWDVPFSTTVSSRPPGPIALALLAYLEAVLRVGVYPSWVCTAWITTVDKGSKDPLDVRPISVLPELFRLISRVLNRRILAVLRKHKILHTAQRAGLTDGDFLQCLDVVVSIIEHAKASGGQLALVLYDQSKAFDLVNPAAIERACARLQLPDKFISLIVSAMRRAKARVRTAFGLSEVVSLCRSLRQGDPLSSILYCIYIDPLHHLLERIGGFKFANLKPRLASAGFMDDTAVAANSFTQAIPLHQAVVNFSLLNEGELNVKKSLLFLSDHQGPLECRALYSPSGPILPVPAAEDKAYRYLGLWVNLSLSWVDMDTIIKKKFWTVFFCIKNNHLPLKAAKLMIDLWLLPVLRHSLRISRYATDPAALLMIDDMQKALNVLMARNAGCPHPKNWSGPIASVLFDTKDMRQHAIALNIEALHLNLNLPADLFPSAAATRARLADFLRSGDSATLSQPRLTPISSVQLPPQTCRDESHLLARIGSLPRRVFKAGRTSHCDVAAKVGLAMQHGLHFRFNPYHCVSPAFRPSTLSVDKFWDLLHMPGGGAHPTVDLMRTLLFHEPPAIWDVYAYEIRWLEDLIEIPPVLIPPLPITIYSDGSAKLHEDAGAAAIFVMGERKLLTVRTRLRSSRNSFLPECVGCLMAAKFTPLNAKAEVVCDCRSALFVAPKSTHDISWRNRLTSAARPVLECIKAILPLRSNSMEWRWLRAHTTFSEQDIDAVFNDQADHQAKTARNILPAPPLQDRTWQWGAERAILTTEQYPSLEPSGPTPAIPRQVMGSVKGFLSRLQKVNLAKRASRSRTMGRAIRYNGEHVLRVISLLSKHASSSTHSSMAMALAYYLPLANRRAWSAESDPRKGSCDWCATGLKQDSPHLFNCPRLMWDSSRRFLELHSAIRSEMGRLSQDSRDMANRICSERDLLRDHLALHLLGRTGDLGSTPLTLQVIRTLPHAALHLAASFAEWATMLSGRQGPITGQRDVGRSCGCIAEAWSQCVDSFRLSIANANHMEATSHNSAPLPELWDVLQDPALPAPVHAVVFEGSPALPPPASLVWYTTSSRNRDLAWWALRLPEVGPTFRLFEWAPLGSPAHLATRAQWWADALSASTDSILWAVIPAESNITPFLASRGLVCYLSHPFLLQLVRPLSPERFWLSAPSSSIQVRSILLLNPLLPPAQQVAWSTVAPTLPALLQGAGRSLRTHEEPRISHVPANWWWGTDSRGRAPLIPSDPSPSILSRRFRCSGDALCEAVCYSPLQQSTFCRYLGNLGIPPVAITDLLAQAGPSLLEGDREVPRWTATAWDSLRQLRKAAAKLG